MVAASRDTFSVGRFRLSLWVNPKNRRDSHYRLFFDELEESGGTVETSFIGELSKKDAQLILKRKLAVGEAEYPWVPPRRFLSIKGEVNTSRSLR
jgi:hypothetical protein